MLNSLQNVKCSFIFTNLFLHTINATISTKKPFLYFSQFSPPYSTLTCSQNCPYNTINIPFLYISATLHLPRFAYTHPNNLQQKYFPYLNHFANLVCVEGPGA